jgi:hypothetical protein
VLGRKPVHAVPLVKVFALTGASVPAESLVPENCEAALLHVQRTYCLLLVAWKLMALRLSKLSVEFYNVCCGKSARPHANKRLTGADVKQTWKPWCDIRHAGCVNA